MIRRGIALTSAFLLACGATGPEALRWGEATCRHCHMTLADRRFGAEVITTHGRLLSFDDAGCAANHLVAGDTPAVEVGSIWVIDYSHPDSLIPAATATYVRSATFLTPMGSGVIAVPTRVTADSLAHEVRGKVLTWTEVLALATAGQLGPR